MTQDALLLIVDQDTPADRATNNAQDVLSAWPGGDPPTLKTLRAGDVLSEPKVLDRGAGVWVMVSDAEDSHLYELVALAQERQLPVLLTRGGETQPIGAAFQDGVVICPPTAPANVAAALLSTMWSQRFAIADMKTELELLRARHGGLTGEMNRMNDELRLAAQLQREFLPGSLPKVASLDFSVLWRPAGYVSGDIYDLVRLDEHHVGLFIADAVGHGVPAALMTMYIKRSLPTKRIDANLPAGYRLVEPSEALGQLNRDLINRDGDQVRFATACYGIIDMRTFVLRIARAGHPFPMILRADGSTQEIEPDGGLLGVFDEETYEQVEVQLQQGDRLLIFSDGFELAFPSDEVSASGKARFDSTRYFQEFEDLRNGSLDEALTRLENKIDAQAGSLNQRDDLTVMCMAITDKPAVPSPAKPLGEKDRRGRPRSIAAA